MDRETYLDPETAARAAAMNLDEFVHFLKIQYAYVKTYGDSEEVSSSPTRSADAGLFKFLAEKKIGLRTYAQIVINEDIAKFKEVFMPNDQIDDERPVLANLSYARILQREKIMQLLESKISFLPSK